MQAANDNVVLDNAGALRFLSVCSGIEAASVAWPQWQAVAFAEIEKFPAAVLAHHYPNVPNLGDFTKIETNTLGRVDILCGGTPCQAFSIAGQRGSLDDERGNLSLEFVRLAHELAAGNGLRNVVWENVPGVLSTKDNAFGCFLAGLVGATDALPPPKGRRWPNAGMVAGPKGRAAWRALDAQYFGLAQRRKRVIVVADFGNGADPAAVLFERAGMSGNYPPSRETGQGVAGGAADCFSASSIGAYRSADVSGADRAAGGGSGGGSENLVAFAPEIARCDATREGSSQDYESTTMVAVGVNGPISHALKAEGADASEDGTVRGTPIIAFGKAIQTAGHQGDRVVGEGDAHPSLNSQGGNNGGGSGALVLAQTVALRGREGGATAELGGDIATALRASTGGGDKPHVLAEVHPTLCREPGGPGSQDWQIHAAVYHTSAVRRLTPRECERLQGFQFRVTPDYHQAWQDESGRWWSPDYTRIPWRGKPASECPDGPRYKALGNSWAVPLFTWLGARITRLMPAIAANDNNKESARDAA